MCCCGVQGVLLQSWALVPEMLRKVQISCEQVSRGCLFVHVFCLFKACARLSMLDMMELLQTGGLTLLPFVVGRTRNELCIRSRGHMLGWANPNPDLPVTGFKIVLPSKSPCVSCTHWAWCHSTHYGFPNPCKGLGFGSGLHPPVFLEAVCAASR